MLVHFSSATTVTSGATASESLVCRYVTKQEVTAINWLVTGGIIRDQSKRGITRGLIAVPRDATRRARRGGDEGGSDGFELCSVLRWISILESVASLADCGGNGISPLKNSAASASSERYRFCS